jgi:enoyl-[acyl-carrier protein] reductase/trans-2-enoyl-CoA reductase (NAD+)
VNKALVTQASSAIPVVPLYICLLYKVMKAEGTHEDCIEQMDRLFRERLYNGNPQPDEAAASVSMTGRWLPPCRNSCSSAGPR